MNITQCPQCGGKVRSESIGWKCESCHGFIDIRGTGRGAGAGDPRAMGRVYAEVSAARSAEGGLTWNG